MAENVKSSKFVKSVKGITKFFREIKSELKKVVWPTWKQLKNNTATVLLACILIGAIIWIVDVGLRQLIDFTLLR